MPFHDYKYPNKLDEVLRKTIVAVYFLQNWAMYSHNYYIIKYKLIHVLKSLKHKYLLIYVFTCPINIHCHFNCPD